MMTAEMVRGPVADWTAPWAVDDHGTLVGRAADLDQIGAFLADIRRSGGPLVLTGESGVGKTALLAASRCQAQINGIRVLSAAGVQYRTRRSYSGLRQLLGAVAVHQPSLVPGSALAIALAHADGQGPDYESVADDLLLLVRRLSQIKPTLLAVDDVQCLDPASAAVLTRVARRLQGTGAALLATARPAAESCFDYSDLPVHDIGPLSDQASEELLILRFPELAPRVRRRLVAYAQGNPQALLELPELLATTRSTFADPVSVGPTDLAALDTAITELAHESDPLRIVRMAIAGAYVDRLGGCAEGLQRVVAGGRRGENLTLAINALFLLGFDAWHTGLWPQLRQLASEGLDLCEQHHYPTFAWPGKFLLACAAAAGGDDATTRSLTGQMDQWAGSGQADAVRAYAAQVRTLSALGRADFEEAYQQVTLIAPAGTMPTLTPQAIWTFLDVVEAAVRTGRRQQAKDHVAAARAIGLDALSPRLRMLMYAASALAADDDRHPGFGQAIAVEGAEGWPFDLARIQLYYGEQLCRGQERTRARRHLALAAETFLRLGARPWADRASQELRACARPAGAGGGFPATRLTPRQREIALLAATGLSNKQIGERLFLSPRTVSTHLYQLFPKLGVTSRAALRDALKAA